MSTEERLPPNYAKLDVALRSIGYSFEAAVADIIDNSIDAGAKDIFVRLVLKKDQPLDIVIWDNGSGMDSETLKEAMRFGADVSHELQRLGKFGLGLKLASLSQAKEVRVFSQYSGRLSGRGWLEEGIKSGFVCNIFTLHECQSALKRLVPDCEWDGSGTVVWWSHLYRVGQNHADPEEYAQKLLNRLYNSLSLAFHRFIAGKPRKIRIVMDIFDADSGQAGVERRVDALNPFGYDQSGHKGFPLELLVGDGYDGRIKLAAHIWPANSEEPEYKLPGGANSRQGFYFYRNNRLIQGGGWNGIREAEPHLSLARVEVDIAPDFDVEVSLDVKKVEVQLPSPLVKAIQTAKAKSGVDFKKYLSLADEIYRTRTTVEAELPIIPSKGIPSELREFLIAELSIKGNTKYRNLDFQWATLDEDVFFDIDLGSDAVYLNQLYRRQLLHGLPGSASDIPVVKCLLFLLLRDAFSADRVGSRLREFLELANRILVKAADFERTVK